MHWQGSGIHSKIHEKPLEQRRSMINTYFKKMVLETCEWNKWKDARLEVNGLIE